MDVVTIIAALAALAIGSGTGGIIGAIIAWKKLQTEGQVGLKSVDVEKFKAEFPGGLEDIIDHWREQAQLVTKESKELRDEVKALRDKEEEDESQIRNLKRQLANTQRQLEKTERDLGRATERIAQLEEGTRHE